SLLGAAESLRGSNAGNSRSAAGGDPRQYRARTRLQGVRQEVRNRRPGGRGAAEEVESRHYGFYSIISRTRHSGPSGFECNRCTPVRSEVESSPQTPSVAEQRDAAPHQQRTA